MNGVVGPYREYIKHSNPKTKWERFSGTLCRFDTFFNMSVQDEKLSFWHFKYKCTFFKVSLSSKWSQFQKYLDEIRLFFGILSVKESSKELNQGVSEI